MILLGNVSGFTSDESTKHYIKRINPVISSVKISFYNIYQSYKWIIEL